MVIFWHLLGFKLLDNHLPSSKRFRRERHILTVGIAVIVLHVYFGDLRFPPPINHPFINSCLILILEATLTSVIGACLEKSQNKSGTGSLESDQSQPLKASELDVNQHSSLKDESVVTSDITVTTAYMKLTTTFQRTTLLFFAQSMLMLYYVYTLNMDRESHDIKNISLLKWTVAIVLAVIVGENEIGSPFVLGNWRELFNTKYGKNPTGCCRCWSYKRTWQIRCAYSFMVNKVFVRIILGTFPILLSSSTPMDFVKDALAVFFITKLDDLDDAVPLWKELEELKKRDDADKTGTDV
jgi:heme/copper-type cytochrome/quinol oxidase subunit 4